jgi:hypothetical protein
VIELDDGLIEFHHDEIEFDHGVIEFHPGEIEFHHDVIEFHDGLIEFRHGGLKQVHNALTHCLTRCYSVSPCHRPYHQPQARGAHQADDGRLSDARLLELCDVAAREVQLRVPVTMAPENFHLLVMHHARRTKKEGRLATTLLSIGRLR